MPYVQSGSVGDFIPELRCLKSVVGVQTRRRKKEVYKRFGRLRPEGSRSELAVYKKFGWLRPEGLRSELGGPAVVRG